jgi:hypothetical protein
MSPEAVQILTYAGFALAGWLLRHFNIGPLPTTPLPSGPAPVPSPGPAHPVLEGLLRQILAIVSAQLPQQPKA